MHLPVLILLLPVLLLHLHVTTASQAVTDSHHDWIYSSSGRMAIRFNPNSTYRFALCSPPNKDGRVVLEPEVKIHSDLLRDAEVFIHVASRTHRHVGSKLAVRSTSALIPLVFPKDFFGEDGRFEIWLNAEFKHVAQRSDSNESLYARFTYTCRFMPPPPPPIS